MANDRLFLACPRCGGEFMLAKHFGDAWSTRNPANGPTFEERLDKFFEEHFGCELTGNDPWELLLLTEHKILEFREQVKIRHG